VLRGKARGSIPEGERQAYFHVGSWYVLESRDVYPCWATEESHCLDSSAIISMEERFRAVILEDAGKIIMKN
jgi:hypothetical protein